MANKTVVTDYGFPVRSITTPSGNSSWIKLEGAVRKPNRSYVCKRRLGNLFHSTEKKYSNGATGNSR